DGATTHGKRARAVGSHAEEHLARITVLDVDALNWNTQLVRDNLCKGRFVSLPMAVRAREHGHLAGRVHAHLAGLVASSPCSQGSSDIGRGDTTRLDVA